VASPRRGHDDSRLSASGCRLPAAPLRALRWQAPPRPAWPALHPATPAARARARSRGRDRST